MKTKLLSLALLLLPGILLAADDCQPVKIELWGKADYAMNGDQLIVQGKRVKLIALEAPQIEKKQKFFTAEQPMAKEAQTKLNKILANHDLQVGVEYDEARIDKFGRILAHLYVKDKLGNLKNVQQLMLQSGLALAAVEPPNLKHQKCYLEAEQFARFENLMLWDLAEKHPDQHYPIVASSEIYAEDNGYRIVKGKILKVQKSSTNYILNMDTTGIRIRKEDWPQFDFNKLASLEGKEVEVRGFVFHYKGAMFITLKHPNAINLLQPR